MRHPLVRAIRGAGLNASDVAARLGVDPKTVQRWLGGRVPYPRHRTALVDLTGWSEHNLWPSITRPTGCDLTPSDIRATYPHRSAVPGDTWYRLFEHAERQIDVLAYSALFLAEDANALRLLQEKARIGTKIRLALGDPAGARVAERGSEEGIDGLMQMRIRNAVVLFRPLIDELGVCLRLHDTTLYASIYRADDELLVNPHVYGSTASHSPALRLTSASNEGMASTYINSFERVWATARDAS